MQPMLSRLRPTAEAWIVHSRVGLALLRLQLSPPAATRGVLCNASTSGQSPPSFDNQSGKRQNQAYFKGDRPAGGRGSASPGRGAASRAAPGRGRGSAKGDDKGDDGRQRLAKVMAAAGVASRRACEDLIEKGVVKVNGNVVQQQGTMVDPAKDIVTVDGKRVMVLEPELVYFMVNKPKGYICSNVDTRDVEGKKVVDILSPWLDEWQRKQKPGSKALPPRLFTVGRLDVASHGLILVTNDGQWAQKVIHPSSQLTKEYVVMVDQAPKRSHLDTIMAGAEVDGTPVAPLEASILESQGQGSHKLRIVVAEGKKHEPEAPSSDSGSSSRSEAASSSGGGTAGGDPVARRVSSSWCVVREGGRDMWVWSVGPWRRVCAEARLAADDRATAPATYADGRPKRRRKEPPVHGKAWSSPDSFPSVFTRREWEAMGESFEWGEDADADEDGGAVSSDGKPCGSHEQRRWQWQEAGVQPGVWLDGSGGGGGGRADSEECDDEAVTSGRGLAGVGLLDPALFDGEGRLLRGVALGAALERLSGPELGDPAQPPGLQGAATRSGEQGAEPRPVLADPPGEGASGTRSAAEAGAGDDDGFLCREEWDWKVRILVANAGLEVLSLKRVRIGGLRVPPTLGIGGFKAMTPKEIKSVLDLSLQEKLRKATWDSASMLLVNEKAEKGSSKGERGGPKDQPAGPRRVR